MTLIDFLNANNGQIGMPERKDGLWADHLKVIAITLMFVDHFAVVFLEPGTVSRMLLRFFGRIVAPIICFLVAEGFFRSSNPRKYITRLLIFAVISHYPFVLVMGYEFFQATSVMWSLAMGLLALMVLKDPKIYPVARLLVLIACCAVSYTANWNFVAVLWIVSFGLFRGNFKGQIAAFCVVGLICHLLPSFLRFTFSSGPIPLYQLGIFLAIPILATYNGRIRNRSGTRARFFYAFYPAHLLLLHLIDRFSPLARALEFLP